MPPRRFVVVGLLFFTLVAAGQQNPPIPKVGESIEVSIVNLDVFVTDRSGARVHGLTRDDFQVFENGKAKPISNFAEYADGQPVEAAPEGSSVASPAPASAPARQRRTFILFIDRFHLTQIHANPFFAALKELLHKSVRPGDSAMILSWQHGVLRTLQPFTDDVVALDRKVDQIAMETTGAAIDDFRQAKGDADEEFQFGKEVEANAARLGIRMGEPDWFSHTDAMGRAKVAKFEQQRKIDNLKALIRSISAAEGKKLMVLASHRLSSVAGAEFLYAAGTTAADLGQYTAEFAAETDLKSLYQTANANGVTIYSMYPEGMLTTYEDASVKGDDRFSSPTGATTSPGETPQVVQFLILNNETSALDEIAEHTGGLSAYGPDSAKLLPRIEDDLQSYYSLAYRAGSGNPDRARNVVVKTKNPRLIVRSRREFIAKSDVTRMEDRVISALFRPPDPSSFQVAVALGTPVANGKKITVPITLRIPISALTALPNGREYAGAFSVYVAWGTQFQRVSETNHKTQSFRIPAGDIVTAKKGYYSYVFGLAADARTERVSLGVLDEVSKDYALSVVNLANLQSMSH